MNAAGQPPVTRRIMARIVAVMCAAVVLVTYRVGGGAGIPFVVLATAAAVGWLLIGNTPVGVGAALGAAVFAILTPDRTLTGRWNAVPYGAAVGGVLAATLRSNPRWPVEITTSTANRVASWWRGMTSETSGADDDVGTSPRRSRWRRVLGSMRRALTSRPAGPSLLRSPLVTHFARDGSTLAIALGAILYAVARLSSQQFYGAVGVSPEEVGVSTQSLLLSAGIGAVIIVSVVMVLDEAVRRFLRVAPLRLALFVAIGVFVGLSGDGSVLDALIGAAFGLVVWSVSLSERFASEPRTWRFVAGVAATALVLTSIVAVDFSESSVDDLQMGQNVNRTIGPFQLAGLQAPTVRIWPVVASSPPPGIAAGTCLNRLGQADGVTVLYQAGRVWRVPTESVISIADDCETDDG